MTTEEERPYKGPKSYQETDQAIFFGRQEETKALTTLIEKNRLVVLFGKTGTGKTSLVNAALFPGLRKNYYLPVYIRATFDNDVSPIESVRNQLRKQLLQAVHKAPENSSEYQFQDSGKSKESLYAYLSRIQFTGGVLTPVLFFDQFEELFKLGFKSMPAETLALVNELAELINTNDTGQTTYKVVLSLREDYMAQLEDLKLQIPAIMRTRFRLKKFLGSQAYEAITRPAPHLITEETAIAIIKELGTEYDDNYYENPVPGENWSNLVIDPIILSLYCHELNELRIKKNLKTINVELVGSSSADEIIRDYYLKAVGDNLKLRTAIEDEMLAEDGKTKGAAKDLDKICLKYAIDKAEFEKLDKEFHLLRIEKQGNSEKVEITHDMIAEQIFICWGKRKEAEIKKALQKDVRNGVIILLCILLFIGAMIYYYYSTNENMKALRSQIDAKDKQITEISAASDSLKAMNNQYLDLLSNKGTGNSEIIRNLRSTLNDRDNQISSLQNTLKIYDARINAQVNSDDKVASLKKQIDSLTFLTHLTIQSNEALNASNSQLRSQLQVSRGDSLKYRPNNKPIVEEHFTGLDCFIETRSVIWNGLYFGADRIEGEDRALIRIEGFGVKGLPIKNQMMEPGNALTFYSDGYNYTFTVISIQKGCERAYVPSVHFSISRYKAK